jgi:hypothetical protein
MDCLQGIVAHPGDIHNSFHRYYYSQPQLFPYSQGGFFWRVTEKEPHSLQQLDFFAQKSLFAGPWPCNGVAAGKKSLIPQ